ncbi:MAG: AbgT family transporter [Prevotellaceae bacterium]|nr:AbgT family transporter [Prevotellaceae bacterium]
MNKFISKIIFSLLAAQILLIFVSWVLDAMQWYEVNSLLSASGIRWFLSKYSDNMASPVLIWILLIACAYGAVSQQFNDNDDENENHQPSTKNMARIVVIVLAVIILIAITLLAFLPHAILLSATGNLYPSPFSDSIVPILCCSTIFLSWVYGSITGTITSIQSTFESLVLGIRDFAPIIVLYLFITLFYHSIIYVF